MIAQAPLAFDQLMLHLPLPGFRAKPPVGQEGRVFRWLKGRNRFILGLWWTYRQLEVAFLAQVEGQGHRFGRRPGMGPVSRGEAEPPAVAGRQMVGYGIEAKGHGIRLSWL